MNRSRLAALACAAALAATAAPSAATAPDAAQSSAYTFTGIRPGTQLVRLLENRVLVTNCTASFVFQDAPGPFDADGPLYLATAAHCYGLGTSVRAMVIPPNGSTAVTVTIGTVVLDTPDDPDDVAIIEIDPAYYDWVSPSVAYWGGPTAAYSGPPRAPVTTVGHGLGTGTGGTPRAGVLDGHGTTFEVFSWATLGDSGSPVTTATGLAVGHVADEDPNGATDTGAGVRWNGPSVQRIEELSGLHLSTCPSRAPWPAPGCPPPV